MSEHEKNYGWRVAYFPTVMSGPVARFRIDADGDREVSASRDGVIVNIPRPAKSPVALVHVITAAFRVYTSLRDMPKRGETRPFDVIAAALGRDWTVERPALFERWPDDR